MKFLYNFFLFVFDFALNACSGTLPSEIQEFLESINFFFAFNYSKKLFFLNPHLQ